MHPFFIYPLILFVLIGISAALSDELNAPAAINLPVLVILASMSVPVLLRTVQTCLNRDSPGRKCQVAPTMEMVSVTTLMTIAVMWVWSEQLSIWVMSIATAGALLARLFDSLIYFINIKDGDTATIGQYATCMTVSFLVIAVSLISELWYDGIRGDMRWFIMMVFLVTGAIAIISGELKRRT